ncbi:hypothetical protein AOG28_16405 [Cobetia sp. UCD-24C]|nr:hypothetical protein AOG28_16405 [Cobetia sp. UCD-24C]
MLPDSDEYLAIHEKKSSNTAYKWVTSQPSSAVIYQRLIKARRVAQDKEGAIVAMIFEDTQQIYVVET